MERVKNKDTFVSCKLTGTTMKVINLGESNTILNKFVAQMRDINIQKDSMRFRQNLERAGEIFAYEISKTLEYSEKPVTTPLGIANMSLHDDKIVYRVADMSGNTAEAVRQIVYSDPIAPQVLLEGKTEVIVLVGSAYEEPGYFAVDNLDGDITDRVVIQGTVDPQTMGTYHLQYTVTDSFGNAGTATRTVIVRDYPELPDNLFPGQAEEPVIPEGRVIYLTFDDGPCAYTNILLDILKKHNVKATFFVINRGYHDILRRIVAEGHTLGMHCGEHTYRKIYASEEAYFADLKEIQDTIYEQTGVISTIVRFPGGSSNAISKFNLGIMTRLTKMLKDMGYRYISRC